MQKVATFIDKNGLEIRLSVYLLAAVTLWAFLMLMLPLGISVFEKANLYFLYFAGALCIIYIAVKKSQSFIFFTPIRFMFFYFLFKILIMNVGLGLNTAILNRQKYEMLDEFIIETYDEKKDVKVTFFEKIFNKLFK
ncbi:hypothetical protein [Chryseobacterium gleum]|uniref:hypothetical protein n=1 Tax=Chryseobacterium gleum TaxID=250 RepID=UPI001E28AEEE|nr:hypothetical protein [Chryseobacterium gleum]MCD9618939.1 hypothetical protein [Chryseobacterium gleum]